MRPPDSLDRSHVHAQNRQTWDRYVRAGQRFTQPASDDELRQPLAVVDGCGWLSGGITGQAVLCLAAGGGRHSALYAAAGGRVTVVDLSAEMLALDRLMASQRGLDIRCVQASMDDLAALEQAEFDLVIHPVSTCYVPDVSTVFREVARVTRQGGLYISQHKQPASLQSSTTPGQSGYALSEPYYRAGPLPAVEGSLHREAGTLEFLHRWEELLGGMCRAGFVIEDVLEPRHAASDAEPGSFGHRSRFVAPYVRIKARRVSAASAERSGPRLWTP